MSKAKNRVAVMSSAPLMAAMANRILTRMMKQDTPNPYDQRRLFLFLDRLRDAMDAEDTNNAVSSSD